MHAQQLGPWLFERLRDPAVFGIEQLSDRAAFGTEEFSGLHVVSKLGSICNWRRVLVCIARCEETHPYFAEVVK